MKLDNEDNYIGILIHSFLRGTISENEKKELFAWIKLDNSNLTFFNQVADIWLSAAVFKDIPQHDLDEAYKRVKTRNDEVSSLPVKIWFRNLPLIWKGAAAVLIPLILFGSLLTRYQASNNRGYAVTSTVFEVPFGSKSTIILPDGSKVILNAGSKLSFKEGFGQKHRNLLLLGEGYFSVKKNKDIPFIVHAGNINVKALGTEFNVKAYPEEKVVETILIQGSIEVNREKKLKSGDKSVVLLPKQSLVYNRETDDIRISVAVDRRNLQKEKLVPLPSISGVKVTKTDVDPAIYTTWKEVAWKIYRKNLSDLAIELERKYDVTITFESERLKAIKFTGTLKDESLEQVLAAISIAFPVEYKIEGKTVELTENKEQMKQFDQYFNNMDSD